MSWHTVVAGLRFAAPAAAGGLTALLVSLGQTPECAAQLGRAALRLFGL